MQKAELLTRAFQSGCAANLVELARTFGISLDEHPFELALAVQAQLEELGLIMRPPLPKGDLASERWIGTLPIQSAKEIELSEILAKDEGTVVEFKSTLLADVRRARSDPTYRATRADQVVHSTLKTVCAFLNTDGGTILLGVEDDRTICGLDMDYRILSEGRQSRDGWELELRNLVEGRFRDGRSVNNFVRVSFAVVGSSDVALVRVSPRSKFSYIRNGDLTETYVRQGNRTVSLGLSEFEDHLWQRWSTRGSE